MGLLGRGRGEGDLRRGVGREESVIQMIWIVVGRGERRIGGGIGMSPLMGIMSVVDGTGKVERSGGGGEATEIWILIQMNLRVLLESVSARAGGQLHHLILMPQMIQGSEGARRDVRRRTGNRGIVRMFRIRLVEGINLPKVTLKFIHLHYKLKK